MYYVILGERANSFYDPISRVAVNPGQVTEVETLPKTSIFNNGLRGQHIRLLTEPEVTAHLKSTGQWKEQESVKPEPTDVEALVSELKELTKKEIVAKYDYFDEEDAAQLKGLNKDDLIAKVLEIDAEYKD